MTYLELSADNSFMDEYTSALFLPHTDLDAFPSVRALLARDREPNEPGSAAADDPAAADPPVDAPATDDHDEATTFQTLDARGAGPSADVRPTWQPLAKRGEAT